MGGTIDILLRLAISMAVVMGVMGLAARLLRRRQGGFGAPRIGFGAGRAGSGAVAPGTRGTPGSPELGSGSRVAAALGWGQARQRRARPALPLEIVYRRHLSKGASLALVEAGGTQYLVGVTDHAVTMLAELPGAAAQSPTESRAGSPGWAAAENDVQQDEWSEVSRMLASSEDAGTSTLPGPASTSGTAWKLALDSLRDRTVRR